MQQKHKKLERLILFREVANSLSYTNAAEKLGISRGHLSGQIKRLEQEMGLTLFIRSTRSVKLTGEGERVLAGMEKIHVALLELEREAAIEKSSIEGLIKITAPTLFTHRFLLEITAQFKVLHPLIQFTIDCSYTSYDLNISDFDIAFRATNQPPQNMIAKQLFSYSPCCCAAKSYFEQYGKPEHPSELLSHQCLSAPDLTSWSFLDIEIAVKGWNQINDNFLLKQLGLQGEGIIRLPEYCVDKEIKQGSLEAIFQGQHLLTNKIFMIYPQLISQSKRLSAFVEFIQQYFLKRQYA